LAQSFLFISRTIILNNMTRIEKIAFILSFWSLFNEKGQVNSCSENQLDKIINGIINRVKNSESINALVHVNSMPVYLN
jgi:hypothetical protein